MGFNLTFPFCDGARVMMRRVFFCVCKTNYGNGNGVDIDWKSPPTCKADDCNPNLNPQ